MTVPTCNRYSAATHECYIAGHYTIVYASGGPTSGTPHLHPCLHQRCHSSHMPYATRTCMTCTVLVMLTCRFRGPPFHCPQSFTNTSAHSACATAVFQVSLSARWVFTWTVSTARGEVIVSCLHTRPLPLHRISMFTSCCCHTCLPCQSSQSGDSTNFLNFSSLS